MAIEDILRALDEQADGDCRDLVENAKVQAKTIMDEAKAEAGRIRDARVAATEAQVRSRATQIVNAAKLERRRRIAAAQDVGIGQVYASAGAALSATRGTPAYEPLFRALAEEAAAHAVGDVVVQVAPGDEALATKVANDLGLNAKVEAAADILGGLTVISGGGRIYRRNTFDDRLTKVRKFVRSDIAEILFA
jgi:vacuolar-type H+-ATPase subunit E/Vma4